MPWVSRWSVCSIVSEPNLVRLRVGYEIDLQKEKKEKKKINRKRRWLGLVSTPRSFAHKLQEFSGDTSPPPGSARGLHTEMLMAQG